MNIQGTLEASAVVAHCGRLYLSLLKLSRSHQSCGFQGLVWILLEPRAKMSHGSKAAANGDKHRKLTDKCYD